MMRLLAIMQNLICYELYIQETRNAFKAVLLLMISFFLFFSISIGLNADVMYVPLCGPSIKPNTIMCIILYILYILCSALNYT